MLLVQMHLFKIDNAVSAFLVLFFVKVEVQEIGVGYYNGVENTRVEGPKTTVVQYPVWSSLKCASECSRDESCDAFAFNECGNLCHKYCIDDYSPGSLVTANGWKYYKKDSNNLGSCTMMPESTLLTSDQVALLSKWLPGKVFRLLYRATRDGMSASTFHDKCDFKGATFSIGKYYGSNDTVGGYTSLSWESSSSYKSDSTAFVFRLCVQGCLSARYNHIMTNHMDVFDTATYGPTFGLGHDLLFFSGNASYDNTNKYFLSNGYCTKLVYSGALHCGSSVKWTDVEVWNVVDVS